MNTDKTSLTYENNHAGKKFAVITRLFAGIFADFLSNEIIERHFYPLYIIYENDSEISQQELACKLHRDKVSVTRIVDYLCSKKCIERHVNPTDRRSYMLRLTKTGNSLIPKIKEALEMLDQSFFRDFSDSEIELFFQLLHRGYQNLEKTPKSDIFMYFVKNKTKS